MSNTLEEEYSQSLLDLFLSSQRSSPRKNRESVESFQLSQDLLDRFMSYDETSQSQQPLPSSVCIPSQICNKHASISISEDLVISQSLIDTFLSFQEKEVATFHSSKLYSSGSTKKPSVISQSRLVSASKPQEATQNSEYEISDDCLLEVLNSTSPAPKRKLLVPPSSGKRMKLAR
jgi:hypothetical protein